MKRAGTSRSADRRSTRRTRRSTSRRRSSTRSSSRATRPALVDARPRREERRAEEGHRLEALEHEVEGSDGLSHGAAEMTRSGTGCRAQSSRRVHGPECRGSRVLADLCLCVLVPCVPARLSRRAASRNAKTETRSAAQGLEREVRAAAARPAATWIGYRMPMVAGPRQMCCFDTIVGLVVLGRHVPPRERRRRVDEHAATCATATRLAHRRSSRRPSSSSLARASRAASSAA